MQNPDLASDDGSAAAQGLRLWLRRLEMRTSLDDADRQTVLALPGHLQEVRANHDFVRLGERIERSCLIVKGTCARFGQTREGARQLTAIHIPGDMADLHSAVLPNATSALSALSDAVIFRVPHRAIHEAVRSSPALARAFWRDCEVDAAIAGEWLVNNGRRGARERLAHLLCELTVRHADAGAQGHQFALGMTQAHLGDALGLTSVHVNRMLGQLRTGGLLTVKGREIAIHDFNGLATVGDFDNDYLHRSRERPDIG